MVISIDEAAKRMGVRPERVRKLIHDGRIAAQRVGRQWIIDEAAFSGKVWIKSPGRPMSANGALNFALALEGQAPSGMSPVENHRLQKNIQVLLTHGDPKRQLQSWMSARARRLEFSVSISDLTDLRTDHRIKLSGISDPRSELLSGHEVEAYISSEDLDPVSSDWFLVPAMGHHKANVVLHVLDRLPAQVPAIFTAMDLAEYPGPREQAEAESIIRSVLNAY